MNPPGIPMFYGAEQASTAVREVRRRSVRVGRFRLNRSVLILDLASLPGVPGIWSNPNRSRRLGLRFLHQFTNAIMQPVMRDDRAHIDYIPSQVVTEYFRDFTFEEGCLDGIRFPSTQDPRGRNVVLFIDAVVTNPAPQWVPALPATPVDFVGWWRVRVRGRGHRARGK